MHLRTEDTDSNSDPDFDAADTNHRLQRPQTFRERHAMKILGVIMVTALVTVISAQVAC